MESRKYGYVCLSTREKNLARQVEALLPYVGDERNIIVDRQSGKDFSRAGYQTLKNQILRESDCLYIKELDRLGRNYAELKQEFNDLTHMGVNIVILDMPILSTADKSDLEKQLICNIVFEIMGYLAEKERLKIRERCREGIEAAKARGVKFGRPRVPKPNNWDEVILEWRLGMLTAAEAMQKLNLKRNTFYKLVKEDSNAV